PTVDKLESLMEKALTIASAPSANPTKAFHSPRTRAVLEELRNHLKDTADLARQVRRDPPPPPARPIEPLHFQLLQSAGKPGQTMSVQMIGSGFREPDQSVFGEDIVVNSTTVSSSRQLAVAIQIPAGATPGPRDVAVVNGDGKFGVRRNAFQVEAPPEPAI